MDAKKYFMRRAIDDIDLSNAIPELLEVIESLKPLRTSKERTRSCIEAWRRSKFEATKKVKLSSGEIVDVDLAYGLINTTLHDRYIDWLLFYFRKMYNDNKQETISFTYALELLTQIHNCQINKNVTYDVPLYSEDEIFDLVEAENGSTLNIMDHNTEDKTKGPLYLVDVKFTDALHKLCNKEVFSCVLPEFMSMVMYANFRELTVINKSKMKKLIAHIKNYVDTKWYKEAANSLGWEPTECTGANVEKTNKWFIKLEKIKPLVPR